MGKRRQASAEMIAALAEGRILDYHDLADEIVRLRGVLVVIHRHAEGREADRWYAITALAGLAEGFAIPPIEAELVRAGFRRVDVGDPEWEVWQGSPSGAGHGHEILLPHLRGNAAWRTHERRARTLLRELDGRNPPSAMPNATDREIAERRLIRRIIEWLGRRREAGKPPPTGREIQLGVHRHADVITPLLAKLVGEGVLEPLVGAHTTRYTLGGDGAVGGLLARFQAAEDAEAEHPPLCSPEPFAPVVSPRLHPRGQRARRWHPPRLALAS